MQLVCADNIERIQHAYATGLVAGNFLPAVYVIEPTSKCNVNCVMCPQSALSASSLGEMPLDRVEKITKAVSPVAELVMLYFMGEPLQHSCFTSLLSIARRNIQGSLVLSTNAMLLTDDKAFDVIDNGIDIVICCLDRWDKKAYEGIRRRASFDTVVANTERLLKIRGDREKPKVIVKALDFHMPDEERKRFLDYWSVRGAIPLVGWIDTWAGQFPSLASLSGTPAPYSKAARVPCADLWFKMVINWRGDAVLCCHNYDYSYPLGHIESSESVWQVWQGKNLTALRQSHLQEIFSCTKLCAGCREWGEIKELNVYTHLKQEEFSLVF